MATSTLDLTTRGVLWAIATHMTVDGKGAFPSQQRLAAMCGITDRSVRRAIRTASEAGWIAIERRRNGQRQGSNIYRVSIPDSPESYRDLSSLQQDMDDHLTASQADMGVRSQADMGVLVTQPYEHNQGYSRAGAREAPMNRRCPGGTKSKAKHENAEVLEMPKSRQREEARSELDTAMPVARPSTSSEVEQLDLLGDKQESTQDGKRRLSAPELREARHEVIGHLNRRMMRRYALDGKTTNRVTDRLREGYTVKQCKQVIDDKIAEWSDSKKMRKYLDPVTLFRPANFPRYLAAIEAVEDEFHEQFEGGI